jgi:hypothetical protein
MRRSQNGGELRLAAMLGDVRFRVAVAMCKRPSETETLRRGRYDSLPNDDAGIERHRRAPGEGQIKLGLTG